MTNNVLAVTADLKRCSVAVTYEGKLFECNDNVNAPTYLVKLAQDLCNENNIDLRKLNRVITVSGPGSFTGIRTAQSFAKGIGLALNIPTTCASYFQVIKHKVGEMLDLGNDFVSIIQNEKNQVYYYDFSTGNMGVSSYDHLLQITKLPLVGDKIEEILKHDFVKFFEVKNYKEAKNFLELTEFEPGIFPLYINSRMQSTTTW